MTGAAPAPPAARLTRRAVFSQTWPLILGQVLVPAVGIVDVAVIGRFGTAATLAGVAVGVTIVNLIFWIFGFLRMSVTGLAAQAKGAGASREVVAVLWRGVALGFVTGAVLLALAPLVLPACLRLMDVPAATLPAARDFTVARFFGAPAAFAFYAINGWLFGIGRTRAALACQVVMNGVNILLDVGFVAGLGWGAHGLGIGTALADWAALAAGLLVTRGVPPWRHGVDAWRDLVALPALRRLFAVNRDLMLRTLALVVLFTWFFRAGARLGATPVAANHILMQFVTVSAYVLDGFAFTAESRTGMAAGARSRSALVRAIRLTAEFCLGGGALFSLLIVAIGGPAIDFITLDAGVRAEAHAMLPFCALIPLIGAPGWLLDGIFIGTTQGPILRNAAMAVTAAYLGIDAALRGHGNTGVWVALLSTYVMRGLSLGVCLPGLVRRVVPSVDRPAPPCAGLAHSIDATRGPGR